MRQKLGLWRTARAEKRPRGAFNTRDRFLIDDLATRALVPRTRYSPPHWHPNSSPSNPEPDPIAATPGAPEARDEVGRPEDGWLPQEVAPPKGPAASPDWTPVQQDGAGHAAEWISETPWIPVDQPAEVFSSETAPEPSDNPVMPVPADGTQRRGRAPRVPATALGLLLSASRRPFQSGRRARHKAQALTQSSRGTGTSSASRVKPPQSPRIRPMPSCRAHTLYAVLGSSTSPWIRQEPGRSQRVTHAGGENSWLPQSGATGGENRIRDELSESWIAPDETPWVAVCSGDVSEIEIRDRRSEAHDEPVADDVWIAAASPHLVGSPLAQSRAVRFRPPAPAPWLRGPHGLSWGRARSAAGALAAVSVLGIAAAIPLSQRSDRRSSGSQVPSRWSAKPPAVPAPAPAPSARPRSAPPWSTTSPVSLPPPSH